MKITQSGMITTVELTERNLLTLLNKLKREDSARTLQMWDGDHLFEVVAVPDKAHYSDREPGMVIREDDPWLIGREEE